jgi:hypothetical protein
MTSRLVLLLVAAFALRLAFGLTSELFGPDEIQIFLIGLQFFTTGLWPDFGPDVVYTHTRIPGGLQGLLVGGPLFVVRQPEAAYVLLNLLTFGAACLLAWYIGRRLPEIPRWFLWTWVLFCPWTLDETTHIINPAYMFVGAVLFFVGAFELVPRLRCGAIPRRVAYVFLGFGVAWVYQFHLSAALLVPIGAVVFVSAAWGRWRDATAGALWVVAGAAAAGITLVPTVLHHGLGVFAGSTGANMRFDPAALLRLPEVTARFLSLASFELARFVGAGTEQRLGFLKDYLWAAPFALFAAACGVAQAAVLLAGFFWTRDMPAGWAAVRGATLGLLALVWLSFTFSIKEPASHAFYVVLPAVLIYSFYCWARLLRRRAFRVVAALLLASGFVTHAALAARNFSSRSLYTNRPLVMRAIQEKNYHLIGERRPNIWK